MKRKIDSTFLGQPVWVGWILAAVQIRLADLYHRLAAIHIMKAPSKELFIVSSAFLRPEAVGITLEAQKILCIADISFATLKPQ